MKVWQLLTDSEIRKLAPKQLLSYMAWLEDYRKNQQQQIAEKRATLQNLLTRNLKNDEATRSASDDHQIDAIRQSLLSS